MYQHGVKEGIAVFFAPFLLIIAFWLVLWVINDVLLVLTFDAVDVAYMLMGGVAAWLIRRKFKNVNTEAFKGVIYRCSVCGYTSSKINFTCCNRQVVERVT